jgi:hypothetical protein
MVTAGTILGVNNPKNSWSSNRIGKSVNFNAGSRPAHEFAYKSTLSGENIVNGLNQYDPLKTD